MQWLYLNKPSYCYKITKAAGLLMCSFKAANMAAQIWQHSVPVCAKSRRWNIRYRSGRFRQNRAWLRFEETKCIMRLRMVTVFHI